MVILWQGSPDMVLESRCPAEFSSKPNQTHLEQLIKVLQSKSPGTKFGDPCSMASLQAHFWNPYFFSVAFYVAYDKLLMLLNVI